MHFCKKATVELQTLKEYGKRVPLHGKTFSIFKKDDDFKTEDLLIDKITFDWEKYKIERIQNGISAFPDLLRKHAMMK